MDAERVVWLKKIQLIQLILLLYDLEKENKKVINPSAFIKYKDKTSDWNALSQQITVKHETMLGKAAV